jgi:uncharacterized protein YbjT (DUF2867 family)
VTLPPSETLITLIGGSGFLGRHIVRSLAKRGYRIRVACRRPDLAGHVQPLGVPGQIMPVQANVRYPDSLDAVVDGAHAVVNLTGVLYSAGAQSFDAIHIFGAEASARAAKAAHAKLFIQMSALSADLHSASAYAKSKAEGEQRARAAFPGAIVLRPSIVFGPEDDFFNRFAEMARFSPVLPLIGGGHTRFQPVYVGDVADAAVAALETPEAAGKTFELAGPRIYSFRQLMALLLAEIGRKRILLSLPRGIARMQARLLELLPRPLLTLDQLKLLERDNIASGGFPGCTELGIQPTGLEAILPAYLDRFRIGGPFART